MVTKVTYAGTSAIMETQRKAVCVALAATAAALVLMLCTLQLCTLQPAGLDIGFAVAVTRLHQIQERTLRLLHKKKLLILHRRCCLLLFSLPAPPPRLT